MLATCVPCSDEEIVDDLTQDKSCGGSVKTSFYDIQFSSVQLLNRVRLFATPWIAARKASLSITNPWSLLKLMPIESVMPTTYLIQ